MPVDTLEWVGDADGRVKMVDQRLLPGAFEHLYCETAEQMWDAIKTLAVRGAPAIGIAGAMGVVLALKRSAAKTGNELILDVDKASEYLGSSRPTAVNLFWALDRMQRVARRHASLDAAALRARLLEEAVAILREDNEICRAIGDNGASLIQDGDNVLTHCNAGGLATGRYGTALSVMFVAHEQGRSFRVYADETRPLLQGARITAWELAEAGIDVTVLCDNAAAWLMKTLPIHRIIVGADRIAANGDAANKIGTYGLAVLAQAHNVPFYVAAPLSTFDLSIESGEQIPIEERDAEEVTVPFGRRTVSEGIPARNPAFDVSPAPLIAGIITEVGILEQPTTEKVQKAFADAKKL